MIDIKNFLTILNALYCKLFSKITSTNTVNRTITPGIEKPTIQIYFNKKYWLESMSERLCHFFVICTEKDSFEEWFIFLGVKVYRNTSMFVK